MSMKKNTLLAIFLVLTLIWYLIYLLIPYDRFANFLGIINLGNGHSWPLSFLLMDILAIALAILFVFIVVQRLKKKQFRWLFLGMLLIYPLITVLATLQDLVFSPIAP